MENNTQTFSLVIRDTKDGFVHRVINEQPQRSNLMGIATGLNQFFAMTRLGFVARVEEDEEW